MDQKYFYFSTGAGINSVGEAILYPTSNFRGMRPNSTTTLDLYFDSIASSSNDNIDCVRLTIGLNTHYSVIRSIQDCLKSTNKICRIADMDAMSTINNNITDVNIYQGRCNANFGVQNITGTSKTLININGGSINSLSLASVHPSTDAIVSLYYASQIGTDISDTGTDSNEADNSATTSSVTLTVDGTAATSDIFADEKVWKSDGTLYGTCTARNSNTEIVFGGGLSQTLANNDSLYTGNRYYALKSVDIPVKTTTVLNSNDISFNNIDYNLYIILTAGLIDLTIRS